MEPELHRLNCAGRMERVTPKAMQVLQCLAARPGQVLTRQQLLAKVWPETAVNEEVLTRAVSDLRKALGETASQARFIETIPKRGYRLVVPVRLPGEIDEAAPPSAAVAREAQGPWRARWLLLVPLGLAVLVVGTMAVVYWAAPRPQAPHPIPLRTRPLTSMPGREVLPAFSPDGNQVAFAQRSLDEGGSWNLFVRMADAESLLQLTDGPEHDVAPAWHPDGDRLAFMRFADDTCSIYEIPSLGGVPIKLSDCGMNQAVDLAYSPDGRWMAFSDRPGQGQSFAIRLLSSDGRESRFLPPPQGQHWGDKDPSFSPDGQSVAFTRSVSMMTQDVFLAPLDGGPAERLTGDAAALYGHAFTPDGRSLLMASNRGGSGGLWRLDLRTRLLQWMPLDIPWPSFPTVSPDGRRVVVQSRRQQADIVRLDLEQGTVTGVVETTRDDIAPAPGPGGLLAYASDRSGSYEIWMRRDGQDRRLTSFGGPFAGSPRISPDGRWVAFDARPHGHADIYLAEVESGRLLRLTQARSSELSPAWSTDGRWIYFGSNRGGQWQIWRSPFPTRGVPPHPKAERASSSTVLASQDDPSTGPLLQQVTSQGGYSGFPGLRGEYLYLIKYDQPGLFRFHLTSGRETLVEALAELRGEGSVVACPQGLCFLRGQEDSTLLIRLNPESGQEEVLQTFPAGRWGRIALAPDGRSLYAVRPAAGESDLVMADLPAAP